MPEFTFADPRQARQPPVNRTLAKLRSGQAVIGTWVMVSRDPAIMRMIAVAGFDFVFIDTEHSSLSWETLGDHCTVARASGLTPIVRTYSHDPALTSRTLDLGAMGVMHSLVSSESQVRSLLEATRYPPLGARGSTALSTPQDYLRLDPAAMKRHINDNTMAVIQIEHIEAAAQAEQIVGVGGLDLVEIGREDLSTSMGFPLQVRSADVLRVVERVALVCRDAGVAVGVNCTSIDDARSLLDLGVNCLSYLSDRRILLTAYYDAVYALGELLSDEDYSKEGHEPRYGTLGTGTTSEVSR